MDMYRYFMLAQSSSVPASLRTLSPRRLFSSKSAAGVSPAYRPRVSLIFRCPFFKGGFQAHKARGLSLEATYLEAPHTGKDAEALSRSATRGATGIAFNQVSLCHFCIQLSAKFIKPSEHSRYADLVFSVPSCMKSV